MSGYSLVLTPNLRSSRFLGALQAHQATSSEPLPAILPWRAWTASLWQQFILAGLEDRVLLNDVQAASLWQYVLQEAGPATLRPARSVMELCMRAHRLACEYEAVERVCKQPAGMETDAEIFAAWLRAFEHHCAEEGFVSLAALELEAAKALRTGQLPGIDGMRCLLYGFDRLSPAQRSLVDALQQAGASVSERPADCSVLSGVQPNGSISPALLRCDSTANEFRHLAQTLRDLLQSGARSISVVLPHVAEARGKLERELRETLPAGIQEPPAWQKQPPWEFSEGSPLTSIALARDALFFLSWLEAPLSPDDVSQVLRSPYFDLGLNTEQAGYLDARILRDRERLRPEWSPAELASATRSIAPGLHSALEALRARARGTHRTVRTYVDWTEYVREILAEAGWPGPRERDSFEFQAVDRWHDLLDQVSSIDMVTPPVSWNEFFKKLQQTAASTLFSPENTGAPIQVMSPSESAGSISDVLWFAQADETRWNAGRTANPMLPFAIQKEFGMPGTDAARDAADAFSVTERLVRSAGSVTFSYGAADESGPVRPSSLVMQLTGIALEDAADLEGNAPTVALEEYLEEGPMPALPQSTVSGGVSILQHQAACAFRAFVERRLFSSEIETTDLGMEARERGSILHRALQIFWRKIKNQSELSKHSHAGTLDAELAYAIAEALPQRDDKDGWTLAYLEIQRKRLLDLLRKWMEYELSRPAFEVLHTEHEVKDVEIGPLRMNVRVDRIDRVDDAGQPATVLIDYKTGEPDVKGWIGDRPGEPQLPVYATTASIENVQAIAFATVKPGRGKLGLRAFPAKSSLLFRTAKEDDETAFEQQLVSWRETLERLAGDFAAGVADVGPKEYPSTCQYCAQRMLCRLNPELLEELAEEEESEAIR